MFRSRTSIQYASSAAAGAELSHTNTRMNTNTNAHQRPTTRERDQPRLNNLFIGGAQLETELSTAVKPSTIAYQSAVTVLDDQQWKQPRPLLLQAEKLQLIDTDTMNGTRSMPSTRDGIRRMHSQSRKTGLINVGATQLKNGSGNPASQQYQWVISPSSSATSSQNASQQPNSSNFNGRKHTNRLYGANVGVHHTEKATLPSRTNTNQNGQPVIVRRTHEERQQCPDRLNLDKCGLTEMPLFENEPQLRLLNLQHNFITSVTQMEAVKRLIFLDLYDNRIDAISGLDCLTSLRVLMLGKNRIRKIEGLSELSKLDVLDLHNNRIEIIQNVSHLHELRVLNLAGNNIRVLDTSAVKGLASLAELNCRRNSIERVSFAAGLGQSRVLPGSRGGSRNSFSDSSNYSTELPSLQRLFLSHNLIDRFESIASITKLAALHEVALDGNPLASDPYYRLTLVKSMPGLKQLDLKHVSPQFIVSWLESFQRSDDERVLRKLISEGGVRTQARGIRLASPTTLSDRDRLMTPNTSSTGASSSRMMKQSGAPGALDCRDTDLSVGSSANGSPTPIQLHQKTLVQTPSMSAKLMSIDGQMNLDDDNAEHFQLPRLRHNKETPLPGFGSFHSHL